ncbi:hypothetical protein SAMN04488513_101140 [Pseudozobellia thermophila]|uniref:Uncharacterized protein n=1 Tax=Pseudozobellia thermophila TaxID=192903 RepID=A0A1M6APP5_9FLAO|nr:hypothetical protein SAMN04488513_101140 [Pseudozobellia thermophila]
MRPKRDIEPIIAYSIAIMLIVYLLASYDTFSVDENRPPHGKWIVVIYKFLLNHEFGSIIAKGVLLLLGIYCCRQLYNAFKTKQ